MTPEATRAELESALRPYANKAVGSLRIDMDDVRAILALLEENRGLAKKLAEAEDDRDDLRDRLHDVVMIDAEEWALTGGGPGIQQRREAAWTRAREPFEP